MKSPVSLCTGVTYDRASIQRWLESGHNVCPATMQPLPTTDLIPNLTLQRLIALWASSSPTAPPVVPAGSAPVGPTLLRELCDVAGADPLPALRKLASFLSDDDVDEFEKRNLFSSAAATKALADVFKRKENVGVDAVEATLRVMVVVLTADSIDAASKRHIPIALAADVPASVAALMRVLKSGSGLESRIDAARVLESLIAATEAETKAAISETPGLIAELVRLIGPADEKGSPDKHAVEAGFACLAEMAGTRRARAEMLELGVLAASIRVLGSNAGPFGKALRIMEAAVGCAEGRVLICDMASTAVPAVLGKMMKAGSEGSEAAVAVLWAVCHKYKDRRAVEAAAGTDGGLTKLLLVMQSGCSPAARQMATDLLKNFKVNAKSCLAGYDFKTTHIMPF